MITENRMTLPGDLATIVPDTQAAFVAARAAIDAERSTTLHESGLSVPTTILSEVWIAIVRLRRALKGLKKDEFGVSGAATFEVLQRLMTAADRACENTFTYLPFESAGPVAMSFRRHVEVAMAAVDEALELLDDLVNCAPAAIETTTTRSAVAHR